MARCTRSRISSDTYPVPFTTNETVLNETPAFFATSRMPTMFILLCAAAIMLIVHSIEPV